LDLEEFDTVPATVTSTTSNSDSIIVMLTETGINTGIFHGSFELISGATQGNKLQISAGDDIMVSFNEGAGARVDIEFDEIEEAGLIEINDFFVNEPDLDFVPVGYGINLKFVDANSSGPIMLTFSYANVKLGPVNPALIGIGHKVGESWIEIVPPGTAIHDPVAKTISGEVTELGLFSLGFEFGPGGGGGGGLPRPGSGLVLDSAISAIIDRDAGSGGHGVGGTATISQATVGQNMETTF